MQRNILGIAVVMSIVFGGLGIGCADRTVSKSESTSQNPITGNTTHKEEAVKERPDGSTYKESSKTTVDH